MRDEPAREVSACAASPSFSAASSSGDPARARGNNINPHVAYGVVTWYRKRMVAGAPEHTLSIQRARPATKFKLLHLTVCDSRGYSEQKAEFDEWARGLAA